MRWHDGSRVSVRVRSFLPPEIHLLFGQAGLMVGFLWRGNRRRPGPGGTRT
ncbi:MAG: hypothetical protein WB626_09335 [Bacteroidota bacterium]